MIHPSACLVCHCKESTTIYSGILRKCCGCGFVTANPENSRIEPERIYTEGYFKGQEYLDYVRDKKVLQKNFRRRIRYIAGKVNPENITSVLEIGCAFGFFGELVRNHFPRASYIGLDISEEPVKYAKDTLNLNVLKMDYLDFENREEFSDVFMWDVIEHLPRPDLILDKIYSEIKYGGRLYITTGDIGALIPRIRKEKWRQIHPPTHLHYFSSDTLTRLLESKGFKIERISYPFIHRGLRQIFYSLFMLGKRPGKMKRAVFDRIPGNITIPFNTFDTMFVIAVRH